MIRRPPRSTLFPYTRSSDLVDALQQALTEAAKDPQYVTDHTTLVDAVFRVFLANANTPLSPEELGKRINRIDKRSEEHTPELQSRQYLVCLLLLENQEHIIR